MTLSKMGFFVSLSINDTRHYDTQRNGLVCDTQHDIQNNDTQNNNNRQQYRVQSAIMLSVAFFIVMLSVAFYIVLLSVVAPFKPAENVPIRLDDEIARVNRP
jgi:hypothetical protein